MSLLRPSLVALVLFLVSGCTAAQFTAPPVDTTDATPTTQPEEDVEADPLYELTEDELRLAFTDGLFGLYRTEVDPATAQRLDAAEIEAWLTDLALVSPRSVAFARATLGPVLDEPYVVGFVLEDAAATACATVRDVLFIPVPERFQDAERPFSGYIVQDACDVTDGELARFCAGGFGTTDDGTACSCVCTTGESPGLDCVACGSN